MKQTTALKLIELTTTFYQTVADSFDQTRQMGWSGWQQLIPFFTDTNCTILDVGCGNGRFAQFLATKTAADFSYTGIDSNTSLLEKAVESLKNIPRIKSQNTIQLDLLANLISKQSSISNIISDKKYSHICVFGLLHHIPDQENVENFITDIAQLLKPNGHLILSFWQPLNHPERFLHKQLSTSEFNIEKSELAENDLLLGWQTNTKVARYCHSFTNAEIKQILSKLSSRLTLINSFQADGKSGDLNQYLVLQNTLKVS